jgi:CheY-like chemotaxis protein
VITILVADDDHKLLNMLRRTLSYEGFCVVTASDGEEALAQVEAERPEAIVLDWMMPKLDGVEVLARLRADADETPILMLTARDAIEDRVEGLQSGAEDYLVKPFAPAELVARLHALLRRSAAAKKEKPLTFADLHLDPVTRVTWRGEQQIRVPPLDLPGPTWPSSAGKGSIPAPLPASVALFVDRIRAGQPDAGLVSGGVYALGGGFWGGGAAAAPRSLIYLPFVARNY